jgi:hypothetical protein
MSKGFLRVKMRRLIKPSKELWGCRVEPITRETRRNSR